MFSRAVRPPGRVAALDRVGARLVARQRAALEHLRQVALLLLALGHARQ